MSPSHSPPHSTSPNSSVSSSPRKPPTSLQKTPLTSSEEAESITLRDHYRGRYNSQSLQLADHPAVRVTLLAPSSQTPSSNDLSDGMISTFRARSRSPGPRPARDKEELQPESSDHPLYTSWWGEERHVIGPRKKKVPLEQTEALQSTRQVSYNAIPNQVSSPMDSEWYGSSRHRSIWVLVLLHFFRCVSTFFV